MSERPLHPLDLKIEGKTTTRTRTTATGQSACVRDGVPFTAFDFSPAEESEQGQNTSGGGLYVVVKATSSKAEQATSSRLTLLAATSSEEDFALDQIHTLAFILMRQ